MLPPLTIPIQPFKQQTLAWQIHIYQTITFVSLIFSLKRLAKKNVILQFEKEQNIKEQKKMKRISLINILLLLALAVLVLTSCKKDDIKYRYVIDKKQGEWIIDYTYTPDYYLRFTIEKDVIHSHTNAPAVFIAATYPPEPLPITITS